MWLDYIECYHFFAIPSECQNLEDEFSFPRQHREWVRNILDLNIWNTSVEMVWYDEHQDHLIVFLIQQYIIYICIYMYDIFKAMNANNEHQNNNNNK